MLVYSIKKKQKKNKKNRTNRVSQKSLLEELTV